MQWKNPDGSLTGGVVIEDGAGNKLGTFANPLNVTGGGGGGSGSNSSVGATGAAAPTSATAVGFQNAAGNLVLPTPSAGLPVADSGAAIAGASIPAGGVGLTGWLSAIWSSAATAANQLIANATLSSILTRLSGTLAISASALPLPSGAAQETGGNLASIAANVSTAANQTTGNTTLASILTKATAIAASLAGTLTTALAAGSNIIGYAGSLNFQTAPVVPTLQAAAYASGNVIGGKQTVSVFRNTIQPSATLSQFLLGWAGTETVAVTVYLFSKNPTNSTITDKAAFVLAAADAPYLAAAPFTLTAAASAGSTQTFAAQSLSLSVKNLDSSATQNLYVVLVVGGAVTPAIGDLFFSISGVLD
jgi:CDP-diglyceride synthetase